VVLQWCLIISVSFGIFIVFNPHGGHNADHPLTVERRYWQSKLKLVSCISWLWWVTLSPVQCKIRQPDNVRMALDEIAHLIASFFAENDFVFSDIVAGLLLLVHSSNQKPPASEQLSLGDADLPAWMSVPDCYPTLLRMLDFSVAIYGWPSYLFNNCGCAPWVRLGRRLGCCGRQAIIDNTRGPQQLNTDLAF